MVTALEAATAMATAAAAVTAGVVVVMACHQLWAVAAAVASLRSVAAQQEQTAMQRLPPFLVFGKPGSAPAAKEVALVAMAVVVVTTAFSGQGAACCTCHGALSGQSAAS